MCLAVSVAEMLHKTHKARTSGCKTFIKM